jgi:hypothetical protein
MVRDIAVNTLNPGSKKLPGEDIAYFGRNSEAQFGDA